MSGVNKVIIIGNLGRDPELRSTSSGTSVTELSVATARKWTNKQTNETNEETEWHKVTVWGKSAEHCANYLSKGRQVYVEGRLKTEKWQDKDGNDRYTTKVVADRVQFLGGRDDSGGGQRQGGGQGDQGGNRGGGGGYQNNGGGQGGNQSGGAPPPYDPGNYAPTGNDDDIPF